MLTDLFDIWTCRTPLHLAVIFGHIGIVELLLEHRSAGEQINVNVADAKGNTPLLEAALRRFSKIAKVRAPRAAPRRKTARAPAARLAGGAPDSEVPPGAKSASLQLPPRPPTLALAP